MGKGNLNFYTHIQKPNYTKLKQSSGKVQSFAIYSFAILLCSRFQYQPSVTRFLDFFQIPPEKQLILLQDVTILHFTLEGFTRGGRTPFITLQERPRIQKAPPLYHLLLLLLRSPSQPSTIKGLRKTYFSSRLRSFMFNL